MNNTKIEVAEYTFSSEQNMSPYRPTLGVKVVWSLGDSRSVYIQSSNPEDFELIGNYLLAEAAKFRREIDRRAQ